MAEHQPPIAAENFEGVTGPSDEHARLPRKDNHDLLFGRLAVHNGLIELENLDRASKEANATAGSLADILVQSGSISTEDRQALEHLVERHLTRHGNDQVRSVSALTPQSDDTVAFVPSVGGARTPRRFGDYELVAEIAHGGMGVVYKAQQARLNRLVALKMIRSGELANDEQVKRFYAEAESAAKLDHPGIVPVYEVGQANGQHFFSMALVAGTSLNTRVTSSGPLPPKEAARLLKSVAEAVEYAHGKGVIHRDIKPHNILLEAAGQPRLTDFGLAKQVAGESELTASGQVLGTPSYMPPEQATGKLDAIGPASDVYSLGATLYFVLTGRPPFQTASAVETIKQVVDAEPVPLRRLNPALPRGLETICLKCLRKEPGRRYATAGELAADIARWLENRPIVARPVGPVERSWLWCKRRPALVGLSLLFLVLSVSGAAAGTLIAVEQRNAARAAGLVDGLVNAEFRQVPFFVRDLAEYRPWAEPLLRSTFDSESDPLSNMRAKVALALLSTDPDQVPFLCHQLPYSGGDKFSVLREALLPHQEQVIEPLWKFALDENEQPFARFQAACALAAYTPDDARWSQVADLVARQLVSKDAAEFVASREALRPAKSQLLRPLGVVYRDSSQLGQRRIYATETLAEFATEPAELVDLLADAETFQYGVIVEKLNTAESIPLLAAELARQPTPETGDEARDQLARRQANSAVALVRLGAAEQAWPLLKHSSDPRARTYFIHWFGTLGNGPKPLIARLKDETDDSIRQALLLTLGEFNEVRLPRADRMLLADELLAQYETEPDSGFHAAAEWLLHTWGEGNKLQAVREKLRAQQEHSQGPKTGERRNWYVNSQGQTMVILEAGNFLMGSPASEPGRREDELQHRRRVARRFAISAHEVTLAQFVAFQAERLEIARRDVSHLVKTDDSPQTEMTWYEAAAYCNWLSQKEGLPEDQWCYEPNSDQQYAAGMKAKPKTGELRGYRLPKENEWEYACRAGTITSRYYGSSNSLLPKYAWSLDEKSHVASPVGRLKPNDFGLFDMLGNAFEWIHEPYQAYPNALQRAVGVVGDAVNDGPARDNLSRVLRGGSFGAHAVAVRCAVRDVDLPTNRGGDYGFRVARTYP